MSDVHDEHLPLVAGDASDARFNLGFVHGVFSVLEENGYRLPEPGPDGAESARNRAYGLALMHLSQLVRAFEGEPER